jgi:hypothetical protein
MDNVQKNAITNYKAPSSEPFRLHLCEVFVLSATSYKDAKL